MNSGSGAATNSGINYQQRVSAAFLTLCLLDNDISIFLNYPQFQNKKIDTLQLEGIDEIDDLIIALENKHKIFFQIKRTVNLSDSKKSDFYKTIDQFIKQYLNNANNESYVLCTTSYSSSKITREFKKLTDSMRLNNLSFESSPFNLEEQKIIAKYEKIVKKLFKQYTKRDMENGEYVEFTKKIYILPFDIEHNTPMEMAIFALMVSKISISPSTLWELLISNCLQYASQRMSLSHQNILEIYADYLIKLDDLKQNNRANDIFKFKFVNLNPASGKEVLLCKANNDLFSGLDTVADYFIVELFRFDDTCRKKLEFTSTHCLLSDKISSLEVIYRASTNLSVEKYMEDNQETFSSKSIVIMPANGIEYIEQSQCAKLYSEKIVKGIKDKKNLFECIECGKAISENDVFMVEVDENKIDNKIGLIHKECRRPTIRVLGQINNELFSEHKAVKKFDWQLWAKQIIRGQGLFRNKMLDDCKSSKVIFWNSSTIRDDNLNYCIKEHLEDGSCDYVFRRGKVERFGKKEAEEKLSFFEIQMSVHEKQNNPLCITQKERIFGTYNALKDRVDMDDELLKIVNVSCEKVTQQILNIYNSIDNYYAPLLYILEGDNQEFFSIDNRVVLLSDPFLFEKYLKNWERHNILINGIYELVIIENDQYFDNLMHRLFNKQMKVVVNPEFDIDGNFTNGFLIEKLEDFNNQEELYSEFDN